MRSTTSFTLHAILAACLAALAASSAAAGDKDSQGFFQMRLGTSASGERGQHIEVQSYQWGSAQSALKLDRTYVKSWSTSGDATNSSGGANEMSMDDTAGKEKMQPGGGHASGNMVMKGSTIGENSAATAGRVSGIAADPADPSGARSGHSMLGASEKISVGGARTESPQAGKGSVWVRVASPWAACRVGARYPSMSLVGGGKSYELENVQVANCGGRAASGPTEEISFVYQKVRVRGWDPEKKEQ